MKNKSLLKTFFWGFFCVCLFQYGMMIPTFLVEKTANTQAIIAAKQFPAKDRAQIKQLYQQTYLDSIADETVLNIPYIAQFTYNDLKSQQLQLGLDLKGGMQVSLGLNAASFLTTLANDSKSPTFLESIKATDQIAALSSTDYIDVFFDNFQEIEEPDNIIRLFSRQIQTEEKPNSVAQLKSIVHQQLNTLIEDTQYLLEQRINSHGLSQTRITKDLNKQLIQIEVPGAQSPERIRSILLSTASLEFWDTYRITDAGMMERFIAADQVLANEQIVENKK